MTTKTLIENRFRWAKKHLKTLENEIGDYLDRKPYRLQVHVDSNRTQYTFRVKVSEWPSEDWPLVISDAVHNLRSTLDNLAFNLAGSPTSEVGEKIQFPIVHPGKQGGRARFDNLVKRGWLTGVHRDARAIIESVQPYHGLRRPRPTHPKPWPPYPLSVLNHMSNVDKHRSPHIGFFQFTDVSFASRVPPKSVTMFRGRLVDDDAVLAIATFADPMQPNVDVHSPKAGLIPAFKIPWGNGRYRVLPLVYLLGIASLIETDILTPLRPFMK